MAGELHAIAEETVERRFNRYLDLACAQVVHFRRADGTQMVLLPIENYERLNGLPRAITVRQL